jgi:hypothetical protein
MTALNSRALQVMSSTRIKSVTEGFDMCGDSQYEPKVFVQLLLRSQRLRF